MWLNPPFSEKYRWIKKTRTQLANDNVETAVLLLPVDTSTEWFHKHVAPGASAICFVEGRLSFDGVDGSPSFGVLVAVFGFASDELLDVLDRKGIVYRTDDQHERTEQQELSTDGGRDVTDDVELPESVVVARRVENYPNPIAGSERRECVGCGHDVWVSPGSLESIENGFYPDSIACLDCATRDATTNDR